MCVWHVLVPDDEFAELLRHRPSKTHARTFLHITHLQLRRRARDTTVAPVRSHISQHPGFRLSSLLVVNPSLCDVHAVPTEPQLNFPGAQQNLRRHLTRSPL